MTRAKQTIPHFYLSETIDVQPAMDFLSALNKDRPPDALAAASLARALDRGKVYLLSRLEPEVVEEITERVVEAGLRRIRPCLMTSFTTLAALVPVMLSTGRGSDVMVPMAIPVFGGMLVVLVSLFVVPTCYCGLKQLKWRWGLPDPDFARESVD